MTAPPAPAARAPTAIAAPVSPSRSQARTSRTARRTGPAARERAARKAAPRPSRGLAARTAARRAAGKPADRRSKEQDRAPAAAALPRGPRSDQEAQHEPEPAEDPDATVAHDRQPALGIHTHEPVKAIREPSRSMPPVDAFQTATTSPADKRDQTTALSTRSASVSPPPSAAR